MTAAVELWLIVLRSDGMQRAIYISRSLIGSDREALAAILAVSKARNEQSGITGLLWWRRDTFAQVLEGEAEAVTTTIERIARDTRHANVDMVSTGRIMTRMFGQWNMAEADGTPDGTAGTSALVSICAAQDSPAARHLFNFLVDAGY